MSCTLMRIVLTVVLMPAMLLLLPSPAWAAAESGDLDCAGLGCGTPGLCCESSCHGASFRTCSGFIGGADFVVLKPITGNLDGITLTDNQNHFNMSHEFNDNDYNITPRLWLGYVNQCGFGVRLRYWHYDHELESDSLHFNLIDVFSMTSQGGMEVWAIDIEATQQITLGRWEANMAAGLRVGRVSHDTQVGIDFLDTTILDLYSRNTFEGVGPTIAAELRRQLGSSSWNFVMTGRGSLLYGETTKSFCANIPLDFTDMRNRGIEASALPGGCLEITRDQIISVAEIQLGLEWTHCLDSGGKVFVEGLFEGQVWANTGGNYLSMSNGSDLGMVGFVLGAGIAR